MITKFELFNEASISDISKLSGNNKLIKSYIDKKFEVEKNLIRFLTLDKRVNNKKLRFKISYHDTVYHIITKKIGDRTSLKSIDHFNEILKIMINTIIQSEYLDINKKYGCYFEEYNFTIDENTFSF